MALKLALTWEEVVAQRESESAQGVGVGVAIGEECAVPVRLSRGNSFSIPWHW